MFKSVLQIYSSFFVNFNDLFFPSAQIDLILLLLDIKPCLRTKAKDYTRHQNMLIQWCREFNLFHTIAYEDFFYLSKNLNILMKAEQVDHSFIPHEKSFGDLMGYPVCCCEKIAQIGEENIDWYESALIREDFEGEFELINPRYYREGRAFISHVPCSPKCLPSLNQAKQFVCFLKLNPESSLLLHWIEELKKFGG